MADESGGCPLKREDIQPMGDLTLPLNPGAPFASFDPNILGGGDPEAIRADCAAANIICDMSSGTLTSAFFGQLTLTAEGMRVDPLWTVSEDGLVLTMDIFHEDCFNDRIPLTTFLSALPDKCPVDRDALGEAAAKALTSGEPVLGAVVAKGRQAVQGRDGRIQLKFNQFAEAGETKADGTVDYRERGAGSNCVLEGEEIAILHPPTPGQPGYNVLGEKFPAQDGKAVNLKPGQGVTSAENQAGQVIFASTQAGMVMIKDGVISISDVMEIPSDVDMNTGNIRVRKGSVHIRGTVTTGFVVEALESIQIDSVVENVTIRAGGDVIIGAGVLMDKGGIIEAGGDVRAKFMRNATVRAGGNVIVDVDLVNCDVIAGGEIIANADKGGLNGGKYVSSGVNVAHIGSSGGAKTVVALTLPDAEEDDIERKRSADRRRVEQLNKFIGTEDIKKTLLMTPKVDRAIVLELYKIKMKLQERIGYFAEEKAALLKERSEALAQLRIKARRTAHPGTIIRIGDKSITLNRAEQASKFHWDAEKSGIAVTGV